MMHDRDPIIVQGPEPITPLEAALNALNAEITSKHLYLEPAPWKALREYVAELEGRIASDKLMMKNEIEWDKEITNLLKECRAELAIAERQIRELVYHD
jgi:hypothetical protein